jgi:hypothetical protein
MSSIDTMARTTPDLLPGTLDLLILRTLQKDARHGWAISERIQQISEDVCRSTRARSIRPCTGSSTRAGSRPNGQSQSWAAAPSTTG